MPAPSKKYKILSLSALILLPLIAFACFALKQKGGKGEIAIRAAIDIGSGSTKLKVAKVNLKTRKIEKVLANESFSIQYQEELEKSKDNTFNEKVMQEGLICLQKSKEIAQKLGAEKVIAVATASFRKAANAEDFINTIYKETGIQVHIVDQDLEGALGFQATVAELDTAPENIIVWDIGGGSYQFSTLDEKGELIVHRGEEASIPFKTLVIKEIKNKNPHHISSPNPLNLEEIQKAEAHAFEISQKVDQLFKEKIASSDTKVVGIGNIFAYRIYPLVEEKSTFTKEELSKKVYELDGKSDSDLSLGDYTNVGVTNPILVLGFMNHLAIDEMHVMDINNSDGAFLHAPFWEDETSLTV